MRGLIGKILERFWCQHDFLKRQSFQYGNGFMVTFYTCSKCGVERISYDQLNPNGDM